MLGISPTCTREEIYRAINKKKREALTILMDKCKRQEYDSELHRYYIETEKSNKDNIKLDNSNELYSECQYLAFYF